MELSITGRRSVVSDFSSSPKYSSYNVKVSPVLSSCRLSEMLSGMKDSVVGVSPRRSTRGFERSKTMRIAPKRVLFNLLVCFAGGVLLGFAYFLTGDVHSSTPDSKHRVIFSDTNDVAKVSLTYSNFTDKYIASENISSGLDQSLKEEMDGSLGNSSDLYSLEYRKLLIIITPTYVHALQAYRLNQLAHTLRLTQPPLLWIVVEMSSQSSETANTLSRTGVMYRHLVAHKNVTELNAKFLQDRAAALVTAGKNTAKLNTRNLHHINASPLVNDKNDSELSTRNLVQRNAALAHIEKHQLDGIVHFADEGSVYSHELFEEMRNISRFGVWPVSSVMDGIEEATYEGPACNENEVMGWDTTSTTARRFHVGFSSFAFNSTILWDPKRWHKLSPKPVRLVDLVSEDSQASSLVEQVVEDESQMECVAHESSRIMAWHHREEASELPHPDGWLLQKHLDVHTPL